MHTYSLLTGGDLVYQTESPEMSDGDREYRSVYGVGASVCMLFVVGPVLWLIYPFQFLIPDWIFDEKINKNSVIFEAEPLSVHERHIPAVPKEPVLMTVVVSCTIIEVSYVSDPAFLYSTKPWHSAASFFLARLLGPNSFQSLLSFITLLLALLRSLHCHCPSNVYYHICKYCTVICLLLEHFCLHIKTMNYYMDSW